MELPPPARPCKAFLPFLALLLLLLLLPLPGHGGEEPVRVGLNAEIGHLTSTSDDAIRQGMLIAMDEINRAGGVLGGRKLELVIRDNRAIPARALEGYRELAADPKVAAVFCGKFSSAVIESLPFIHQAGLPLLNPWAANDKVVENGYKPNYVFRLSLRDKWAVPTMMKYARKRGIRKAGLLLVNTSFGRNNQEVIGKYVAAHPDVEVVDTQWVNYGDNTVAPQYDSFLKTKAQAVLFVGIEPEGALLVREIASRPPRERLPVVSHWAIAGGDVPAMTGSALGKADLAFVQTFDLHGDRSPRAAKVLETARRLFGIRSFSEVKSPAGLAHAYDLTHILARAIDRAGTTDRARVRDALEKLGPYTGLIRRYAPPFTVERHEALGPGNSFMARYGKDGRILPIAGTVLGEDGGI